jgi:hypothetical protein
MNINTLWYICLLVRISFIFLIRYLYKTNKSTDNKLLDILPYIIMFIGLGFLYKGITGSNDEIQVANVFWHETRYTHATLYVLASIYLYSRNINMNTLLLSSDVIFSIMYRLLSNQ